MTPPTQRYAGRRVLVLGASGFIGRQVVRALSRDGAALELGVRDVPLARRVLAQAGSAAAFHAVDLADAEASEALVERLAPDVVFNLAGYGIDRAERDEALAGRVNGALPADLARALIGLEARRADPGDRKPRLVHVGSALEYGEVGGDLRESGPVNPTTLYGRTKLVGTLAVAQLCADADLPAVTARLFTVFGPGEHPGRLFPTLLERARESGPIPLTEGRQKRDFAFVEDVAEGLLRLGDCSVGPGDVVNLATGRLHTVRDFVERAAETLGIAPERLDFGAIPTRSEEMQHDPVSIERLRARTGWRPPDDLAAALARARDSALV